MPSEPRERLKPWFPKAVHVRDTVRNVLAVGPHSESGKLPYGFWPAARLLGDVHLDPCALDELNFFQWLEDSVLVFGRDGHEVRPRNSRIPGWAPRAPHSSRAHQTGSLRRD